MDNVTGLIVPNEGTQMQISSGHLVDIPANFFVHPQTGRVLPVHGNVAYDIVTSKLIFTVDSATGIVIISSRKISYILEPRT